MPRFLGVFLRLGAKKRENIVEKAQKTTKPCDFRLKQRFFGLNSYRDSVNDFLAELVC
jgi:hypothetical protein